MKKRLLIFAGLLLLSAGIVIVLMSKPWSTVEKGFEGMVIGSPDRVDRIEVIGSSDTLVIMKVSGDWQLNEEQSLNSLPVESLLYTSSKLRVVSMLNKTGATFQKDDIALKFFEGRKLLSSFRFVVIDRKSFIYQDEDDKAYQVELPGYDYVTLKKVYSSDPDHYSDHLLLALLPEEIAEIQIWPLHGTAFKVIQDAAFQLSIQDFDGQELEYSERKIRLLLSYFSAIRYEAYPPVEMIPLDFAKATPAAKIVLVDFSGFRHTLEIYAWTKPGESSPDLFNALVKTGGDSRTMIVNYTYLDLLIRGQENYLPGQ